MNKVTSTLLAAVAVFACAAAATAAAAEAGPKPQQEQAQRPPSQEGGKKPMREGGATPPAQKPPAGIPAGGPSTPKTTPGVNPGGRMGNAPAYDAETGQARTYAALQRSRGGNPGGRMGRAHVFDEGEAPLLLRTNAALQQAPRDQWRRGTEAVTARETYAPGAKPAVEAMVLGPAKSPSGPASTASAQDRALLEEELRAAIAEALDLTDEWATPQSLASIADSARLSPESSSAQMRIEALMNVSLTTVVALDATQAVPEPSSSALALLGLAAMVLCRREATRLRRRNS